MKKQRLSLKWPIFLILLLTAAGVAGVYILPDNQNSKSQDLQVFVEAKRGDIEEVVTAQGTLEPKEYVDVGAQVSGQLEVLHVDIGDQVKSGDLIAEIDAQVFESQVAADEARLKTMEAQKLQTQAEIRQAQQKLQRNKQLIENKAISQEAYEDSQTALDIIKAQLMSLEAQIEEAKFTLEGNKAKLNYTKIYAPMNGTVVSLEAKEGQTLNANQTTPLIVQIADLDFMTVKAQVAEADIHKIKPGNEAYFTTLSSRNKKWHGRVRQVFPNPEVINSVVLYHVLVDVENKDRELMNGMTTQMFFVLGQAANALTIPAAALTAPGEPAPEQEGTPYIVQVKKGKTIEERNITVGLSNRTNVQILSGLEEGESVLLPMPADDSSQRGSRMRTPRL